MPDSSVHHRLDDLENLICYLRLVNIVHHRLDDLEIVPIPHLIMQNVHHRLDDLETGGIKNPH